MSSGSACWILWLTPMDWLALSIGRSGSQPLEYSIIVNNQTSIIRRLGEAIIHTVEWDCMVNVHGLLGEDFTRFMVIVLDLLGMDGNVQSNLLVLIQINSNYPIPQQ